MSFGNRGDNERTCRHQDTTSVPVADWAADGETAGKSGNRYDERDAELLQGISDVLEDRSIFSMR